VIFLLYDEIGNLYCRILSVHGKEEGLQSKVSEGEDIGLFLRQLYPNFTTLPLPLFV
jgi:hypothetical protein